VEKAVELQRLSLLDANSTIALRAPRGSRDTTPIETPGPAGYRMRYPWWRHRRCFS